MRSFVSVSYAILAIGIWQGAAAQAPQSASLKAGAAKVDVTPAVSELPKNYEGIFDHLYSRAIVLESGASTEALITVDAGAVPDPIWRSVTEQVEKELGIPAKNVLLTATHTHSAPMQPTPNYAQKIVESVKMAKQRLAPARIGYGTGVSYINVNRNILDPQTKRWWEGPNYD